MLKINYEIVRCLVLSHAFVDFVRDLWDFSMESSGLDRTIERGISRASSSADLVDWENWEENFLIYWSSVSYAKDLVRMNGFKTFLPNEVVSRVVSEGYWKNRREAHKNDLYVYSHSYADEVRGHCGPYDCMHFENVDIYKPVFKRAVCCFCGESDKSLVKYTDEDYWHENVTCGVLE